MWVNRCDPCCSHAWGSCSCVSAAEYFTGFAVADAAVQAEALVSDLRTQDIRIGTQDLRIAAIALVQGATVVTSNTHDFAQVPGLAIEDWAAM